MRKPGYCPEGHRCLNEDINGLTIKCHICGWLDDSRLSDFVISMSEEEQQKMAKFLKRDD